MRCSSIIPAFALVAAVAASTSAQIADQAQRTQAIRFFRAGQELLAAEQFEKALDAFSKALENDKLLSIAHYGMGQANMNLRRYASAAKAYRDAIEAMRALHNLQQTSKFEVDRQREDEVRELRTILNQNGTMREPTRIQLEQRLRDLDQQRHSTAGVFQPPAEVLLALGSAYFRNADQAAAEANWKAAVEVNPKYGEAHNNLAVVYMQTGRLKDAQSEMKLAEKNGFRVNPQFKTDLEARQKQAPKAQ